MTSATTVLVVLTVQMTQVVTSLELQPSWSLIESVSFEEPGTIDVHKNFSHTANQSQAATDLLRILVLDNM